MTLSLKDVGLVVGVIIAGLLSSCGRGSAPPPTGAAPETRQASVVTQAPTPTTLATTTSAPTVTPIPTPSPNTIQITPCRRGRACPYPGRATARVAPTHYLKGIAPSPIPTLSPTPIITLTPTPHPLAGYTITGLRARAYGGGNIEMTHVVTETASFTKYLIRYPSDDLTITAMMNVPKGEGPFPVVILNHGYIPPSRFWSGADTWRAADDLASQGYLTISPDFRGWGGSDKGDNFFRTGLVIDILNLISSLSSLPQAEADRVGMWGHSMGAGATTKAITIDPRIRAAVIYGPVSADDQDVLGRWGPGSGGGPDDSLTRAYREASSDREFLQLTSPINYFEWVVAPVQIHQGTADQTTPPSWAEAIRDALQAAGKDVEYFSYAGAGHAFEGESWDLFMGRVTDFFDRTLKGGVGESAS